MRKLVFILALGAAMGCRGGAGLCGPNSVACIFASGAGASARIAALATNTTVLPALQNVAKDAGDTPALQLRRVAFAGAASAHDVAGSVALQTQDENARKARAMLDQMIEAMGGQAWRNIQDVSQEGRTYSFAHNGESSVGTPFWRFFKRPD